MSHAIKNLASGTLIYGFGQAANRLVGFLLLPLFTAFLTPRDYGVISLLTLITFIITQVFSLGFGVSLGIIYFKEDDNIRRNATIWTAFQTLLIFCCCALVILYPLADQISRLLFKEGGFSQLVIFSSISAAFSVLCQPFVMQLQFENQAMRYTMFNLIATLVTTALNVVFVVLLRRGVEGWVVSNLIGSVITFVLFAAIAGKRPALLQLDVAKKLLWLGLPMVPSFIFMLIMQHSGRYMLQAERGLEELGVYNIGYTFGMISSLAVNAFTTAWYPYFNSFVNRQEESRAIFARIATYYVTVFGLITVFFFVFAKPLVIMFAQSPFYQSHWVIGPITLANVFSGLFCVVLPGIYFAQEVRLVNIVQVASCFLVVILNAILIPSMGLVGAAVSMAIGFAAMAMFQLVLNRIRGYLAIEYQWKRLLGFSVLFIAVILPVYVLQPETLLANIAVSISLFLTALAGCWMVLEHDEKQKIKSQLARISQTV